MKTELFPKYLNRLQYFARLVLFVVFVGVVACLMLALIPKNSPSDEINPLVVLVLAALALIVISARILALDIPRMRSAGWNPWLLLLFIVPGGGAILQLCLFLAVPKYSDPSTDSSYIFPATSSGGRLANRILMGFVWFVAFEFIFIIIISLYFTITGQVDEMPDNLNLPITISAFLLATVCTIFGLLPGTKKKTTATI